ncbi:flavodoxin domain-containing protein [Mucilaginibacter celer]|uniref:Flavodoxin domain-containing protein n=1 Tax=Mucilaginibacter celer TaxID=2305508 RepID=A0A494VPT7_9SPHI|nr:flavodoxin domain-containing protein [Mucilaginibacter celer]AYL95170.1 hypothetical protein HYN43_007620 [Mucilaginibacter celer]
MKGIIIYGGKYGATEQYAHWLADALEMPVSKAEDVTANALKLYEVVVIGSSVYVGSLVLRDWLARNNSSLKQKKLFIFIVSSANGQDLHQQQMLINNNFKRNIIDTAKMFFLPGRCEVAKLSWKDKLLLKMGAWLEKNPQKKWIMKKGFDYMDRRRLDDIVGQIEGLGDV